jgi:hypothetical protein
MLNLYKRKYTDSQTYGFDSPILSWPSVSTSHNILLLNLKYVPIPYRVLSIPAYMYCKYFSIASHRLNLSEYGALSLSVLCTVRTVHVGPDTYPAPDPWLARSLPYLLYTQYVLCTCTPYSLTTTSKCVRVVHAGTTCFQANAPPTLLSTNGICQNASFMSCDPLQFVVEGFPVNMKL